eukprot:11830384-Karenia_brevis.AAC.1
MRLAQIGLQFSPKHGKSQYTFVGEGSGDDFVTAGGISPKRLLGGVVVHMRQSPTYESSWH